MTFKKTQPNVICKEMASEVVFGKLTLIEADRIMKEGRQLRTYLLVLEHPQTLTQAAEGGSRRGLQ